MKKDISYYLGPLFVLLLPVISFSQEVKDMKIYEEGDFNIMYTVKDYNGSDIDIKQFFSFEGAKKFTEAWVEKPIVFNQEPYNVKSQYIHTIDNKKIILIRSLFKKHTHAMVLIAYEKDNILYTINCFNTAEDNISISSGRCAKAIQKNLGITISPKDETK